MASHVVATDARSIPASVVSAAAATYGLDPNVVVVLTRVAADGNLGEPAGSVAKLVSLASTSAFHTPSVLGKMQEAVMPGGEIVVGVLGDTSSNVAPAPEGDLLVAGFTDAKAAGGVVPGVAPGALAASKPTWNAGASFSLKSRKLKENAAPLNALNGDGNAAKAWKLGGDDDDILDEDDLLDETDLRSGADEPRRLATRAKGAAPRRARTAAAGGPRRRLRRRRGSARR